MELIPDLTERVTAATDFMMAVVAFIGVIQFRREQDKSTWKVNLWTAIYVLFIIAATLGTLHHGLSLSPSAYESSWLAILLTLGIMVGLFVVALIYDLFGKKTANAGLPVMILIALAFFGYSWSQGQDYSLFLMYEALALLSAMLGYAYLALRQVPGSLAMATGVFITIVAAIVQATKALSYTIIVPFDHNANYHLIQIVAILFLTSGIKQSIRQQPAQAQ